MKGTLALDNITARRVGRHWLLSDGTLLPVVGGGDGPEGAEGTPIVIPESFDDLDDDALDGLISELEAAFDVLLDNDGDLEEMTRIANGITAARAEVSNRETEAAEADAERQRLAGLVHGSPEGEGDEDGEGGEGDGSEAPEGAAEGAAEGEGAEGAPASQPEPVAAGAGTRPAPRGRPLGRRRGASASGVGQHGQGIPSGARTQPTATLVAGAGTPGRNVGQAMSLTDVATAFHDSARGLREGQQAHVATIQVPVPEDRMIRTTDPMDALRVLTAASARPEGSTAQEAAQALVAAGGWCAPPQVVYDLFALESTDGLLDVPTIGVTRGGIQVPDFLDLEDTTGALWTWTETNDSDALSQAAVTNKALATNVVTLTTATPHLLDVGDRVTVSGVGSPFDGVYVVASTPTATTFTYAKTAADVGSAAVSPPGLVTNADPDPTKPCIRIPCPGFTEYTLEAEGLCITHGNLADRAWPELTSRFVSLVTAAHLHRISAAVLTKILADITAASNNVTVTATGSDTYGEILSAIALQVADIRSQFKMADDAVFEAYLPHWTREAMRAALALRAGVDLIDVPLSRITNAITALGVRPQFVHALDAMWSGTNQTAWPTAATVVVAPAGTYFRGTGGSIDLGVSRDSVLNRTNDHTVAMSEEFYLVGRRGPAGRKLTITVDNTQAALCCA